MKKLNNDVLVEVKGLKKYFEVGGGLFSSKQIVHAVDGVDLSIKKGQTFGFMGESGCGKTTTGLVILRLLEPTEGKVIFKGTDVSGLNKADMRAIRRDMQMIFQDPLGSLDPRMRVGDIVSEPLAIHDIGNKTERQDSVYKLLKVVGLSPHLTVRYAHELSGGQRQRVGIARAITLNPQFIVADEPVSALDVSVRSQILNLMKDLQEEFGLTYLFITHDFSVLRFMSDVIAVMYLGKIVEVAGKNEIHLNPQHPYTQALISSIPTYDPTIMKKKIILEGDVPSPINPPSGCRFHTRCPHVRPKCKEIVPELVKTSESHQVACIRLGEF